MGFLPFFKHHKHGNEPTIIHRLKHHWRLATLSLAALLVLAALFHPKLPIPRDTYRYLFVLDITQSMNARDYHAEGWPADRLGYAKAAIRRVLHDLPCGSEVGLGLFTTQSVQFLFEPIEICGHFPIVDDVLSHIDWRMAWAGDSHVEQGLYAAVREVGKSGPGLRLAFFTDGQETPPLSLKPNFNGKPGEVKGLIVGVGGTHPSPVPRYDRDNRLLGNWENADIAVPPVSTTDYSEKLEAQALPRQGIYLSWLDEAHLKDIAAITGLRYHRLEDPADLSRRLREPDFAERRPAATDLRPLLGLAALMLVLLVHGMETGPRRRRR
jgi:mxaL protein